MRERTRQALPAVVSLVLFLVALAVLRSELHSVSWQDLTRDVLNTPVRQMAWAVAFTALNYAVLTGYDLIAFAYVGRHLDRWRIVVASFLAYAIANNVGFAMLSGAAVRYRFYTRWGVTADELSRIIVSNSVTFWLGLLALGGFSLALSPLPAAHGLPVRSLIAPVGWCLMLTSLAYIAVTLVRRRPIRIRSFELPLPAPAIAAAQLLISAADWTLAGAVLYALLPPSDLTFPALLAAFLAAQLLGLASHVPGGLGVFEGLMVLLLAPSLPSGELVPALVVYRVVYYLLPLTVALVALVADETRKRRSHLARANAWLGRVAEQVTPRVIAAFTFVAGLVLLFSGATPAASGRLLLLGRVLPLGLIETSHFLSSLVGAGLLLLSQGLSRRLDAAHAMTVAALALGIAASLFKGADYEEALILGGVLLVLVRARPAFDRRAALFDAPFSAHWTALVIAALATSVWLGIFAFRHVDYSNDLWWQVSLNGEASRFLRASVGATVVVMLFAISRLLKGVPPDACEPTGTDIADAAAVIATQTRTAPFLVFLRDKSLIFNDTRTAFVMYAVQGRTWVAMGDPVGPEAAYPALIRAFLERCADYDGVPAFYQVRKETLHHYADVGLTFVKLGEEAVVDLAAFTLEGPHGARHRQALRRLEREDGHFRVVPADGVPAIMGQLRVLSDGWLRDKAGAEKGFSLGFFDETYIGLGPVAVIERQGRVLAFGNLWPGPDHVELSVDLMRYDHDAPKGVMEMLFIHLMLWGRDQGYRRFTLGMSPLSGVEASPIAPLWNRLGAFVYEHGEPIYRFQGLRAFKDRFDPMWEPRYLAYVGGMRLPRILADVAALVAGGYRRIFIK